ncbi:MAG: hypothetical protein NHB32_07015 [Fischerella sp. CENA71]|nr:hypothetical protein [Fischerella sp. CENA71]
MRYNTLPSITWDEPQKLPSNTWEADSLQPCNTPNVENTQTSTALLPQLEALEALRDRLKVGTEVR